MKNFRNLCFLIFFIKLFNTAFAGQIEISVLKVISEPDENTTHTIFLILDSKTFSKYVSAKYFTLFND